MKQDIFEMIKNQSSLPIEQIALRIGASALLGALIFLSYMISHRGAIYSKKFNVSLVILTMLTGVVMTVIGNNVALSLGMVGALSIVRFRTAIKDSRDTVYIFWAVIAGICCGVGDYLVAASGSAAVFVVMLLFGAIKSDNRMLIIIRGRGSSRGAAEECVKNLFGNKAVMRVRNTTEETFELIYEVSRKTVVRTESRNGSVNEALYKLGGIEYVNIVMQNDEVSN